MILEPKGFGESHAFQNAGLIGIDWDTKSVELAVINKTGEKIIQNPVTFSNVEFKSGTPSRYE